MQMILGMFVLYQVWGMLFPSSSNIMSQCTNCSPEMITDMFKAPQHELGTFVNSDFVTI